MTPNSAIAQVDQFDEQSYYPASHDPWAAKLDMLWSDYPVQLNDQKIGYSRNCPSNSLINKDITVHTQGKTRLVPRLENVGKYFLSMGLEGRPVSMPAGHFCL